MKKIYILLSSILLCVSSFAQQLPLYTQYFFNPFIYNPSQAGINENVNAILIHRSQWNDIPGAPVTSVFSIDGPIKMKNVGLGVSVYNDVTDIINRMGINSSYSYKLDLSQSSLYFGLGLGVSDNRFDFSKAIIRDVNDPFLMQQMQRKTNIDASFGTTYKWDKLVAGISVPQLLANKVEFRNNDSRAYYNLSRHYLLSAKYTFDVSEAKGITAYPLVMVRAAQGIPMQYDINAVAEWMDRGWFALSYKSDFAVGLNLGVTIGGLRAGYAYDISTGAYRSFSGNTHEILLGYTFGKRGNDDTEKLQTYEARITENEEQIRQNKDEIDRLKKDVNKLKSEKETQGAAPIPADTTSGITTGSDKKGFMTTGLTEDFIDENGNRVKMGNYLVVGSFLKKEFAESASKKFKEKGYSDAKIITNTKTGFNYVYVIFAENNEALVNDLTKIRSVDAPDSWIFRLED